MLTSLRMIIMRLESHSEQCPHNDKPKRNVLRNGCLPKLTVIPSGRLITSGSRTFTLSWAHVPGKWLDISVIGLGRRRFGT